MSASRFTACTVCGRPVIETGAKFHLEAAVDVAGEYPAVDFLAPLYNEEPQGQPIGTLTDRTRRYCRRAKLVQPEQLNRLDDNLWEFKADTLRLVFYDTGDDSCGIRTLRATHVFTKGTPFTPLKEIDRGNAIARHDAGLKTP